MMGHLNVVLGTQWHTYLEWERSRRRNRWRELEGPDTYPHLLEAEYKVYSRWDRVPERLSKMYPGSSSKSFWECGQEGMVLHVCWTCTNVRCFWMCVHILIYSVTMVKITRNAWVVLLNEPVENIPKHNEILIIYCISSSQDSDCHDLEEPWDWLFFTET